MVLKPFRLRHLFKPEDQGNEKVREDEQPSTTNCKMVSDTNDDVIAATDGTGNNAHEGLTKDLQELNQSSQHSQSELQEVNNNKPAVDRRQPATQRVNTIAQDDTESSSHPPPPLPPPPDHESVYDFYTRELFPAIVASFPILLGRVWQDAFQWLQVAAHKLYLFVLPKWMKENYETVQQQLLQQQSNAIQASRHAHQLWEQALESSKNSSIADFVLHHFDSNQDGHISTAELVNFTESLLSRLPVPLRNVGGDSNGGGSSDSLSFWTWFSREWPLMDWKIGVFLWHTFGGLLLVIAVLSIVPGRLHSWSGRILRWPILALTYLLISVELVVYIVIRLVIRVAEMLFAKPKHRTLRRQMTQASSYEEWYSYAAALDLSQKRDKWQRTVDDASSYQYNWPLIRQLMTDMKEAREKRQDPLQALAVLQQCTRKNVGGIMSEDLFSKTYTGEPKAIVLEFIAEVTKTLQWVTDQALWKEQVQQELEQYQQQQQGQDLEQYEKRFERKARNERDKLWQSLIALATLNFQSRDEHEKNGDNKNQKPEDEQKKEGAPSRPSNQRTEGDDFVVQIPSSKASSDAGDIDDGMNQSDLLSQGSSPSNAMVLPGCHREQLLIFMKRARAAYGRTALCLSGGAMMGLYHIGHLRGLMETDCLPHIVSGCSAGSVIGAVLCTRTNEELARDLQPQAIGPKMKCFERSWPDRFVSVWKTGNLFSGDEWQEMIRWFTCGDMTFEEAYNKTGRILCIALAATKKRTPPVLLNYISAPHVTIGSAVVASAAVPGFVSPQHLKVKDVDGTVRIAGPETYFDGSIRHDIPTAGLSEMLNCQFFVACQCNPHIVPFFFNPKGGVGRYVIRTMNSRQRLWIPFFSHIFFLFLLLLGLVVGRVDGRKRAGGEAFC